MPQPITIEELSRSILAHMGVEMQRWAEAHPEEFKEALEFQAKLLADLEVALVKGTSDIEPLGFLNAGKEA